MAIHYLEGDATDPIASTSARYIVQVNNNEGGWGAGFVLAISRRWPEPEKAYREWYRNGSHPRSGPFALGSVQFVSVSSAQNRLLWVCNMIAQDGYGKDGGIPLQYDALETCLQKVANDARATCGSIHMPRIGCSLAGGKWSKVEPIIQRTMRDLPVFIYDFKGGFYNP